MKKFWFTITFALLVTIPLVAQDEIKQDSLPAPILRFISADIYIDSDGRPLAAYQIEAKYDNSIVKIVGLEGGETKAYNNPPFYDPRGLSGGRIIIAAFTLSDSEAPRMKTRVARLHLQIQGEQYPEFKIKLMTAVEPQGSPIKAKTEIIFNDSQH